MNTMDFDKIDKLIQSKDFEKLTANEREFILRQMTESEYCSIRELYLNTKAKNNNEISPSPTLKKRLDKALAIQNNSTSGAKFRIPLYQVAAVALIFLAIGMAINYHQEAPARVVTQKIREIKYIDRPVEKIRYIAVPSKYAQKVQPTKQPASQENMVDNDIPTTEFKTEINPEISRQQEIAMMNIERALNEKNGVSIGSDTVLQKMMVTVY